MPTVNTEASGNTLDTDFASAPANSEVIKIILNVDLNILIKRI